LPTTRLHNKRWSISNLWSSPGRLVPAPSAIPSAAAKEQHQED